MALNLKAAEAPAKEKPLAKPPALENKRLLSEEFVRKSYRASIPSDVTWEQVLQPAYWSAVSSKLLAGDEIVAVRDDLAWRGELMVCQAFGTHVRVAPISFVEIDKGAPIDISARSGFRVVDEGLTLKWCIYRIADNHLMASNIETAELAHQQIHSDLVPRARKRGFG
jgi:hypothetical protein